MITCPIYQDTYYEIPTFDYVDYKIIDNKNEEVIYTGTAFHSPENKVRIKINDICKSYIQNMVDEQFFSSNRYEYEIPVFDLIIDNINRESYQFTFGPLNNTSEPINGHYIPSKKIWYSQYN